jgi:hypothetical protein
MIRRTLPNGSQRCCAIFLRRCGWRGWSPCGLCGVVQHRVLRIRSFRYVCKGWPGVARGAAGGARKQGLPAFDAADPGIPVLKEARAEYARVP